MKFLILFPMKNKQNIISLSSAEFVHSMVGQSVNLSSLVDYLHLSITGNKVLG